MKIGILGGGQLARMMALAGYPLGHRFVVFDPTEDVCAADLCDHVCAEYDDEAALKSFADRVDLITLDFENVPVSAVDVLTQWAPVMPGANALRVAQDRLLELIAGATDQTTLSPETLRDQALVWDFRRELEFHYLTSRSVADYASLVGCSTKTLTRATKRVLGQTPKDVIDQRVANAACRLLAHTDLSVGWISFKLGFTEQSNFSKFFQRKVEMTPAAYRLSCQAANVTDELG